MPATSAAHQTRLLSLAANTINAKITNNQKKIPTAVAAPAPSSPSGMASLGFSGAGSTSGSPVRSRSFVKSLRVASLRVAGLGVNATIIKDKSKVVTKKPSHGNHHTRGPTGSTQTPIAKVARNRIAKKPTILAAGPRAPATANAAPTNNTIRNTPMIVVKHSTN